MLKLRNAVTRLQWPMVFFLPFWLTFGRGLLGSSGWGTIVFLLFLAPGLFVVLLAVTILTRTSRAFKTVRLVSSIDAVLLVVLYLSAFLLGFFIVDGGDTEESLNSIATHLFTQSFAGASNVLAGIFYWIGTVALIGCIVSALFGRFRFLRLKRVYIPLLAAALVSVVLGVFLHYQHRNSPSAKDEQISYDFQLMRNDIDVMTSDGELPPGSALDIAKQGRYGTEFHIDRRAAAYTYKPLQQQKKFQLCTYFNTNTLDGYPVTPLGSDNEYRHGSGYQCIVSDAI